MENYKRILSLFLQKADLAVADLTITYEREQGVDFTMPFMNLGENPSFIYSWSISHILEHEFFCLGRLGSSGSKGKKVDLSYTEQLLRVFFSIF